MLTLLTSMPVCPKPVPVENPFDPDLPCPLVAEDPRVGRHGLGMLHFAIYALRCADAGIQCQVFDQELEPLQIETVQKENLGGLRVTSPFFVAKSFEVPTALCCQCLAISQRISGVTVTLGLPMA